MAVKANHQRSPSKPTHLISPTQKARIGSDDPNPISVSFSQKPPFRLNKSTFLVKTHRLNTNFFFLHINSLFHNINQVSGMEFFRKAKSLRLKSIHEKYLIADADEESVFQDRVGSSDCAKWMVEFVDGAENVVRLKGNFGKVLTALDEEFLLGVTGRKVVQSLPLKLDSSIEWEPIRDGMQVKMKTRYGNYLRANGGLPPWRNSVTHDIPHRHHDWILWDVDVVEIRSESNSIDCDDDLRCSSFHLKLPSPESSRTSLEDSPRKYEGRLVHYRVADDDGNVDDAVEGPCFQLKGNKLEELIQRLEEETGLEDIIVCCRNRVNGKLYPLRLALPPDNATLHVVVVPSTSTAANEFMPPTVMTGEASLAMERKAAELDDEERFQREAIDLEMNVGEEANYCLKKKEEVCGHHLAIN